MNLKTILLLVTIMSFMLSSCSQICRDEKITSKTDKLNQKDNTEFKHNQNPLTMLKSDKRTLSCKLTSPELQQRKATVIVGLKSNIIDKIELKNGYSYKFMNTDENHRFTSRFYQNRKAMLRFFQFQYVCFQRSVHPNGYYRPARYQGLY